MEERLGTHDPSAPPGSRWVKCAGCGRQFRLEAGQGREVRYCPTCDYRHARKQLVKLNHEHGTESESDPSED